MYAGAASWRAAKVQKIFFAKPKHPYTRGAAREPSALATRGGGDAATTAGDSRDRCRDLRNLPFAGCRFADRCSFVIDKCTKEEPHCCLDVVRRA